MAAFGQGWMSHSMAEGFCFKAERRRWWAEYRWCGCYKTLLFTLGSEGAILQGAEV